MRKETATGQIEPIVGRLRDLAGFLWDSKQPGHDVARNAADEIERLRDAVRECADDLEAEIQARAPGELARRIERDMAPVRKARALLTPNATLSGPARGTPE